MIDVLNPPQRTPQGTFLPPRNAQEQLNQAAKSLAEQDAAGRKAITEACGSDFLPPATLVGAAKIIKQLRVDRDAAKTQAIHNSQAVAQAMGAMANDIRAALTGTPLADSSPLSQVAKTIANLRDELTRANATRDAFYANVRSTLVDRAMMEIPGLAGYFTGATPLQCAAEAAAVYVTFHGTIPPMADKYGVQAEYLRRRGWHMAVNNAWIGPDGANSLPLDAAVLRQVKIDVAPFRSFAKREWMDEKTNPARWKGSQAKVIATANGVGPSMLNGLLPKIPADANLDAPVVAPSTDDYLSDNFTMPESTAEWGGVESSLDFVPDAKGEDPDSVVVDEVEPPPAETPVIHMTQPIHPASPRRSVDLGCITKINGVVVDPNAPTPRRGPASGSSAETIVIPALR